MRSLLAQVGMANDSETKAKLPVLDESFAILPDETCSPFVAPACLRRRSKGHGLRDPARSGLSVRGYRAAFA